MGIRDRSSQACGAAKRREQYAAKSDKWQNSFNQETCLKDVSQFATFRHANQLSGVARFEFDAALFSAGQTQ